MSAIKLPPVVRVGDGEPHVRAALLGGHVEAHAIGRAAAPGSGAGTRSARGR